MKQLKLSEETKIKLFEKFVEKFKKELENFENSLNETKFSFSGELSSVAKEKIHVIYDPFAYLKMQALVDYYDTEVSWYGLIRQIDPRTYYIYDVKVYKQTVSGAKVDTEDEDMLEFFDSLSDEEFNDLHFQAHSHVRMSTGASGVDLQNQADIVKNMGNKGFYMFQIWNKSGDINTYLYDVDNNVFYDKKDIIIDFSDGKTTISDFVLDTTELVVEKKFTNCSSAQNNKGKDKKKETTTYLPSYYDGYGYNYERWDY